MSSGTKMIPLRRRRWPHHRHLDGKSSLIEPAYSFGTIDHFFRLRDCWRQFLRNTLFARVYSGAVLFEPNGSCHAVELPIWERMAGSLVIQTVTISHYDVF